MILKSNKHIEQLRESTKEKTIKHNCVLKGLKEKKVIGFKIFILYLYVNF